MRSLRVDMGRVGPGGESLRGELESGILDLPGEEQSVRPEGPVMYDLELTVVTGQVVVRGQVWGRVGFLCSRCLEWFVDTVCEDDFLWSAPAEEVGDWLDLTAEVRESMLLRFPSYPVCSPACKGLCPRCGANRNAGACECSEEPREMRWSGLDGLNLGRG